MGRMSALHLPPEWAPHRAIWTAWPFDIDEWGGDVGPARLQIGAMVRALAEGDVVRVLARPGEPARSAREAVGDCADVIEAIYGDSWLRDTAPLFARRGAAPVALGFRTNGWGGKFVMDGDERVAADVAARTGAPFEQQDFVLEGGAIDGDGEGTFLTTRQCLLNANRNGWDEAAAEAALARALGARKIVWLDEGLLNDHTDGHVDNIARFVGPGRVLCQAPSGDDPNARTLDAIADALHAARDAQGRKLEIVRAPSPGLVAGADGAPMPASHMNFIIGNQTIVMPIYNEFGAEAAAVLQTLFPDRRVVALPADRILAGGGAFHCITREEPA